MDNRSSIHIWSKYKKKRGKESFTSVADIKDHYLDILRHYGKD